MATKNANGTKESLALWVMCRLWPILCCLLVRAFAVLASFLGTARRQNQPALKFLHTLFTADIHAAQAALYPNSA
jgi:hypothetical protein